MNHEKRAGIRAQCVENGISWARASIGDWSEGEVNLYVREWVNDFDRIEADEHEKERQRLSKLALEAAQKSAQTSADAAAASRVSARWTMWAAVAAFASALISAVVALAQYLRLMPT